MPATRKPRIGATIDGLSTFSTTPSQSTTFVPPPSAIAAPPIPPTSACELDEGRPSPHVTRFQTIAPTRPAVTIGSVNAPGSMIFEPIVAATLIETNAPRKLSAPASTTARRGEIERVATAVAIAFAASWNPFVKSNARATAMTRISVSTGAETRGRTRAPRRRDHNHSFTKTHL